MARDWTLSPEQQRLRFAMSEWERETAALDREGLADGIDEDSIAEACEGLDKLIDEMRADAPANEVT